MVASPSARKLRLVATALARSTEHPEFMSMWDRCISRGAPGWIIPAGYNNAYQIVQTPRMSSFTPR